jgi:hypothetical protein
VFLIYLAIVPKKDIAFSSIRQKVILNEEPPTEAYRSLRACYEFIPSKPNLILVFARFAGASEVKSWRKSGMPHYQQL